MAIRKIGILGRTYRHVQRYREVLGVLFHFGFGGLVDRLKIEQYLEVGLQMISHRRRERVEPLSWAERTRMAIEELGPTFVKMGQILSTRPDLLPVEFALELDKLQDRVPPFEFAQARSIVEAELDAPLESIFPEFDPVPLASASLGQVHRARLADGEQVVVKVQRPDLKKTIEVDMEILLHLATLAERHMEGWEVHRPTRIIEELARSLDQELDYRREAAHMERFASQFAGDPTVYVPKVYREQTTTRVLTMERVEGVKASDLAGLAAAGLDRCAIIRRGTDLLMEQVFVHGFFHADPHPGNLFILPGEVICYLDFGMMGRLDQQTRDTVADLVASVARRDETSVLDVLLRLTEWDEPLDRRQLQHDVAGFMDRYLYGPLKEIELGPLLRQLMETASRHRLRIPADLFLMIKALSTMEGLGRSLDPDFDIIGHAAPFVRRIQLARYHPSRVTREMVRSGTELFHLLGEIPAELRGILRQAKQGKVKIEFEHHGLEPMLTTLDQISNRLAFAVVLASLVIGSALIVLSKIPPVWNEIPVVGLAGFVVAGLMSFWLLLSILKHGRM